MCIGNLRSYSKFVSKRDLCEVEFFGRFLERTKVPLRRTLISLLIAR
jgi:hypothetical protein